MRPLFRELRAKSDPKENYYHCFQMSGTIRWRDHHALCTCAESLPAEYDQTGRPDVLIYEMLMDEMIKKCHLFIHIGTQCGRPCVRIPNRRAGRESASEIFLFP